VFGGDVHFEGPLGVRLAADPATALGSDVATLLAGANLSMTNFESALTYGSCPDPQAKEYVFYAPPTAITAFRNAHVTLVTEANNHGEDCGRAGMEQALAIARRAGYPIIGIGQDAAHARSSRRLRYWTPTWPPRGQPPRHSQGSPRRIRKKSWSPRCSGRGRPLTL
jgi:hypothetical protein